MIMQRGEGCICGSVGGCLADRSPPLPSVLAEHEKEGWILASTHGSAKQHPKVGWVAGYGCVVMGDWEAKGFLPPKLGLDQQ